MSAEEIIDQLPRLTRRELEDVDAHLHRLLQNPGRKSWGEALLEVAGTAKSLPEDLSANHDHYLHGTPKR
jgi:hypothetical protein